MPPKIFYSYAQADEALRDELAKHLSGLRRQGLISEWHDNKADPGADLTEEINAHLDAADIILLLVSADFFNSDKCYSHMTRALERRQQGGVHVIPILLRPYLWRKTKLGGLAPLPKNAEPVTKDSWDSRDDAFLSIVNGLLEIIERVSETPLADLVQAAPAAPSVAGNLPFLCDREVQEFNLTSALSEYEEKLSRRPFLCVVHGNAEEDPDKFKDRMLERFLPKYLGLDGHDAAIRDKQLSAQSRDLSKRQIFNVLRLYLAKMFQCPRTASLQEVAKAISEKPSPVLVYTHLLTERWADGGAETMNALIEFWQRFPDLATGLRLIVCLILTHRTATEAHRQNKDAALRYLKSLDFSRRRNVRGVVLPELEPISASEVSQWIKTSDYFEGFCANHAGYCNVNKFIGHIESIFQKSERIPMALLADQLARLLDECRCERRK